MNKPPITFRLSNIELQVLEREQKLEESINQTAARLLREKLGIVAVDSKYTLQSTALANWIDNAINSKLEELNLVSESFMSDEIKRINQRLGDIEDKLPKPRVRKSTSTNTK